MNKKIFENARFCPKGDIEANWNKANGFIPLNKEIIIYKPDENHSAARFKIGDGKTKVQDLPFSGANIDEIKKLVDEKGELLIDYVDRSVAAIKIPQPDWNQHNENAVDYIKNKPFGEKNFFKPITWDGVVGYKEKVDVSDFTSDNMYAVKVSDAVLTYEDYLGATVKAMTPDGEQTLQILEDMLIPKDEVDSVGACGVLDIAITVVDVNKFNSAMGVNLFKVPGTYVLYAPNYSVYVSLLSKSEISKIDEKYLPDSIDNRIAELEGKITAAIFNITSDNTTISLQNLEGMTKIDWGDGTINNSYQHIYSIIGEYECKIYGVTTIGEDAFSDCSSLTSVVIGDSVKTIGWYAFSYCDSLTSVEIGGNVTAIDYQAFGYCDSLTSVKFKSISPANIVQHVFYKTANLKSIIVPKGTLNNYQSSWSKSLSESILKLIVEDDFNREVYYSDIENCNVNCNIENGSGPKSIKQVDRGGEKGNTFTFYRDGVCNNPDADDYAKTLSPVPFQNETINGKAGQVIHDAVGPHSSVFGGISRAIGERSQATGSTTIAVGAVSHTEGTSTVAFGPNSHAEGFTTTAIGDSSHSEGANTVAKGTASHSEGIFTKALKNYSHAEGEKSQALGVRSHAEGYNTQAIGENSHSDGLESIAEGNHSSASGEHTHAKGYASHTHGGFTKAEYPYQTSIGLYNKNSENNIFEIGYGTKNTPKNIFEVTKEGIGRLPGAPINENDIVRYQDILFHIQPGLKDGSLQQVNKGKNSNISISNSNNSYLDSIPSWPGSKVINSTTGKITSVSISAGANGTNSTALGVSRTEGDGSFSEGYLNVALGKYSHAEGARNIANGRASHVEGEGNLALGDYSYAGGSKCIAKGAYSFAGGNGSIAENQASIAFGRSAKTGRDYQAAFGRYNEGKSTTLLEIGNGNSGDPKNIFEVNANGGFNTYGGTSKIEGSLVVDNFNAKKANLHMFFDNITFKLSNSNKLSGKKLTYNRDNSPNFWSHLSNISLTESISFSVENLNTSNPVLKVFRNGTYREDTCYPAKVESITTSAAPNKYCTLQGPNVAYISDDKKKIKFFVKSGYQSGADSAIYLEDAYPEYEITATAVPMPDNNGKYYISEVQIKVFSLQTIVSFPTLRLEEGTSNSQGNITVNKYKLMSILLPDTDIQKEIVKDKDGYCTLNIENISSSQDKYIPLLFSV